ncbi:MAG: 50S ribosomal protein L9 [Bdellovibrionales bacterium]|nr:50S ribosomal protein L9 [Bdellovibrionales bacterium]
MKVILQKDVKNVGKLGDLVNVKDGFARNFLFPRKLAQVATEKRMKEWQHLQKVAEVRKKKMALERRTIVEKMNGQVIKFIKEAGASDKLFGSVTTLDISNELEKLGFSVDKRDIHLEEPIKTLGQFSAVVKLGEKIEATISVAVEKQ